MPLSLCETPEAPGVGRGGSTSLASLLSEATEPLEDPDLTDGSLLQNRPYQFCFLFTGPTQTLPSPAVFCWVRMASLKLLTSQRPRDSFSRSCSQTALRLGEHRQAPRGLSQTPGPPHRELCHLFQVDLPLCASVSPSVE